VDYGRCPCGGTYENRWVEVRIPIPDADPIVEINIPQGACPICGSRVYKAQILDLIETMWHQRGSAQN
jgi:hypothetical protein